MGVVSLFDSCVEDVLAVAFLIFFSLGTESRSVFDITQRRFPSQESVIM